MSRASRLRFCAQHHWRSRFEDQLQVNYKDWLLKKVSDEFLKGSKVEEFQAAKKAGKFLLNCNVGGNRLAYGLREWRATQERKTDGTVEGGEATVEGGAEGQAVAEPGTVVA